MDERHYMRYTPIDIMHRIRSKIKHTCVHCDELIRNADVDLRHHTDEIQHMIRSLSEVQEDLCEMYSPKEGLLDDLDDLLDDIMEELDELHYMLRDRSSLSSGLHNKQMKAVRSEIHKAINEHLTKHHDIYGAYKLGL